MSGLWSFRTPATGDDPFQVIKQALPLAFVVSSPAPAVHPCTSVDDNDLSPNGPSERGAEAGAIDCDDEISSGLYDGIQIQRDWLRGMCAATEGVSAELGPVEEALLALHPMGGGTMAALNRCSESTPFRTADDDALTTLKLADSASMTGAASNGHDDDSAGVSLHLALMQALDDVASSRTAPPQRDTSRRDRTRQGLKPSATGMARCNKPVPTNAHLRLWQDARTRRQVSVSAAAETKKTNEVDQARIDAVAARGAVQRATEARLAVEREVERRQCAEAVMKMQRARAAQRVMDQHQLPPTQPSIRPSATSRSTSVQIKSDEIQTGTQMRSGSSGGANMLKTTNARQPKASDGSCEPTSTRGCGEHDVFSRLTRPLDPSRRHLATNQAAIPKIHQEIAEMEQAGMRIVFDPRKVREHRLREFQRVTAAVALRSSDEANAHRLAADAFVKRQNELRLLRHYGWKPWRCVRCETKLVESHAARFRLGRIAKNVFQSWRVFCVANKRVRRAVAVARSVAWIQMLRFAWKRAVLLKWRCAVWAEKARRNAADRHRKLGLWGRWGRALRRRQQARLEALESLGDRASRACERQRMRRCWLRWKDACDAIALERSRVAFRQAAARSMATLASEYVLK